MKMINTLYLSLLAAFGARVFNSSNALTSQGMTIAAGNGASPEVFTTIAEVSSIDGPTGQAPEIDVTDLSSTAREFVFGLKDEGEITLDLNYIPTNTQHDQLRTDKNAGTLRNYRITFTNSPANTWTFGAYVKGLSISNAVDNVTKASVTLRLSGAITQA